MIEKIIRDYLTEALIEPVGMEVPFEPPSEFVVVEKTGSRAAQHIYHATVAIQSYSGSLYGAAQLNEKVKLAMTGADVLPSICRVDLNSDYNYTDTASKRYRYQAVFDIVHY